MSQPCSILQTSSTIRILTSLRAPPLISIQIHFLKTQNLRWASQFKFSSHNFKTLLLLWIPNRQMQITSKLPIQKATWITKLLHQMANRFLVLLTNNCNLTEFIRIQQLLQVQLKLLVLKIKILFCNDLFIKLIRLWKVMISQILLIKKWVCMLIIYL